MTSVPERPFLVVGEALVDIVVPQDGPVQQAPGGSPLNVAVGLARLGVPTLLMTRIGDDDLGRLVTDHVRGSDVQLHEGAVVSGTDTSRATAHLDESGAASYTFDLAWDFDRTVLPEDISALHVGSLGVALRPGREAVLRLVEQAAASGHLVSFDPNARPILTPDAEQAWRDVREVAAHAQLVKMSDEDLEFLQPGRTPEQVAAELLGGPTRLVVFTFGGEGAAAFSQGWDAEVQSGRTTVVDTVGAGDSFMAALLAVVVEHGLDGLDERRLAAYVTAAHQAAAITVSRRGADPPRRDELPAGWPKLD